MRFSLYFCPQIHAHAAPLTFCSLGRSQLQPIGVGSNGEETKRKVKTAADILLSMHGPSPINH